MERINLTICLLAVVLLCSFDSTHGAARSFSRDGKDTAMKIFRSINPGIQWNRWLVNLAGASSDCSDVGRQGAVTITKRSLTPEGQTFAGFVDSTPGDRKDADSVTKYITTVVNGWPSRYEIRSQIEQARKVGCAVSPGCRGNVLIVCVFSPAIGGSTTGGRQPNPYNQPNRWNDRYNQPEDVDRIQPVDPRYNYNQPGQPNREEEGARIQPYDPRYGQPNQPNRDVDRIQPYDPRSSQPNNREGEARIQPYDPRYGQPSDREGEARIQPYDPRSGQQNNRDGEARIQPYDPRSSQPNNRDGEARIQPYDPRSSQPNNREGEARIQPYDPRSSQPNNRDGEARIQPYDPRSREGEAGIQPYDPRYGQPNNRDGEARIQPVDPNYGQPPPGQPRVDPLYGQPPPQPDPRYNRQPNNQRNSQPSNQRNNQPGSQPQPRREEEVFRSQPYYPPPPPNNDEDRIQPVQPIDPRYAYQPTDTRARSPPSEPRESRGRYGYDQPSHSSDRRTVNYQGGQVTFEKVDDPQPSGHSHTGLSHKEMRRRRKEEKQRRRQQGRQTDIYDRMISDDVMLGDDPNANLGGNMGNKEFSDYLRKYDSRHPVAPQHLKKAADTVVEKPKGKESGIETQSSTDHQDFFWAEQEPGLPKEKSEIVVDKQEAVDSAVGRARGSRDVEVLEPLPRRVVLSEDPQPIVPQVELEESKKEENKKEENKKEENKKEENKKEENKKEENKKAESTEEGVKNQTEVENKNATAIAKNRKKRMHSVSDYERDSKYGRYQALVDARPGDRRYEALQSARQSEIDWKREYEQRYVRARGGTQEDRTSYSNRYDGRNPAPAERPIPKRVRLQPPPPQVQRERSQDNTRRDDRSQPRYEQNGRQRGYDVMQPERPATPERYDPRKEMERRERNQRQDRTRARTAEDTRDTRDRSRQRSPQPVQQPARQTDRQRQPERLPDRQTARQPGRPEEQRHWFENQRTRDRASDNQRTRSRTPQRSRDRNNQDRRTPDRNRERSYPQARPQPPPALPQPTPVSDRFPRPNPVYNPDPRWSQTGREVDRRPYPYYTPRPRPAPRPTPVTDYFPVPRPRPVPRQVPRPVPVLAPETPRAFSEEQRKEAEQAFGKDWDRTYFLENLSAIEASCKMADQESWPFQEAQRYGIERGFDIRGYFAKTYNRRSTPDAIRTTLRTINGETAGLRSNQFGCVVTPDCMDRSNRMQVVVVCLFRVDRFVPRRIF